MSGMTPERLAKIREQVEWERAQTGLYWPRELPGKANLDRADLLDEVDRLLDVVLNPDGEDLAEYIAMHEADLTEGEADAC